MQLTYSPEIKLRERSHESSPNGIGEISVRTSSAFLRYAAIVASALFGLGRSTDAKAQSAPEAPIVRMKYVYYKDFQTSGQDRMSAKSPMLWFDSPLGDSWEVEGGGLIDSLSGASPYYLDSLSGASGTGIHDRRRAGDLKFTRYFENFSLSAGGAYSNENDYLSRTGTIEARGWNEDKSTVFSIGASIDWDDISSSNNPDLEEFRRTKHFLFGVTQILNPVSILQTNLTYSPGKGYYNDPYKLFENRPRSREEWAWLARYVLFVRELEGSLHADYRLFWNSWGNVSHTIALSYYQPFGEKLTVRPSLRYYTQSKSDLFNTEIPPLDPDALNSADQRLAGFGSITAGVKVAYQVTKSLEIDALYDYMLQSHRLNPAASDDEVRNLIAHYIEIGLMKKF